MPSWLSFRHCSCAEWKSTSITHIAQPNMRRTALEMNWRRSSLTTIGRKATRGCSGGSSLEAISSTTPGLTSNATQQPSPAITKHIDHNQKRSQINQNEIDRVRHRFAKECKYDSGGNQPAAKNECKNTYAYLKWNSPNAARI
jgi:hypothetical protein